MIDFSRMLERFQSTNIKTEKTKEEFQKDPKINLNIMYDKSLKDMGVLVRMNNLLKRLEVINYLIGDWKPS